MPEVASEMVIAAPVERVYRLAKDVEGLAEFLPNVERVTIREREGSRTVSEWLGRVPEFGRSIRWVEEDLWEEAEMRCEFRLLSGDWDRYQGEWRFAREGDGTRVGLKIEYEYNVPLIGALLKKLLHKLVARTVEETLAGLRARAEDRG